MKYAVCLFLSFLLIACGKSGKEEKELATQAFIDCDFYGAKHNAQLAVEYAGSNLDVAVPALLIIGKSSEFIGEESTAYSRIVELAPGVSSEKEAKDIANNFVQSLSKLAPEKVKACSELQG